MQGAATQVATGLGKLIQALHPDACTRLHLAGAELLKHGRTMYVTYCKLNGLMVWVVVCTGMRGMSHSCKATTAQQCK